MEPGGELENVQKLAKISNNRSKMAKTGKYGFRHAQSKIDYDWLILVKMAKTGMRFGKLGKNGKKLA